MRYALQKLGQFLAVFFLVTFGVMVFMRLGLNKPGDPARTMLGGVASDELIAKTTKNYSLDANPFTQYFVWLKKMVTGDMGFSVNQSQPVTALARTRLITTLLLGIYALVWALIIAVPLAIRQARNRDSSFDRLGSFGTFVFVSVPAIVLAPLLTLVFVNWLKWFPRISDNEAYPWNDLGAHFKSYFLPTVTITLPLAAVFTRLLRSDLVATLQSDFITLAKAKGVSPRKVMWTHALRNSLFSLLTSVGTNLGSIIGGAVVAETFFDLDGLGSLLVVSVLSSDLFTVQAFAAIIVFAVVLVNFLVDLAYGWIDPRIRQMRSLG